MCLYMYSTPTAPVWIHWVSVFKAAVVKLPNGMSIYIVLMCEQLYTFNTLQSTFGIVIGL